MPPQSDTMAFHEQHRDDHTIDDIKPVEGLGRKIQHDVVMDYLVAGKCIITVKSIGPRKPGMPERMTYKIACKRKTKPENADIWFINVLTGANNSSDYTYLGFIKNIDGTMQFRRGKDSPITADAPSCKIWEYVFKIFASRQSHPQLEVWHEGRCCRCGRRLTDPISIAMGMGSECAGITKLMRPLAILEAIKKGQLKDYQELLKNRTDITLTPEEMMRVVKLTKGYKLLQRLGA